MFSMLMHVFGISGLLYHGGTMYHKIIPILIDFIVKDGHIDPKIFKKKYPTFGNIFAKYWYSIVKQLKKLWPFE